MHIREDIKPVRDWKEELTENKKNTETKGYSSRTETERFIRRRERAQ